MPSLFQLEVGNVYIALAGETERERVLEMIRRYVKPEQAARFIPVEQLGTTDDCGCSPFADDTSTTRDTAFAKIRSRVLGTTLAAKALGRPT